MATRILRSERATLDRKLGLSSRCVPDCRRCAPGGIQINSWHQAKGRHEMAVVLKRRDDRGARILAQASPGSVLRRRGLDNERREPA